ncbi:guanine nucleotide-binding protein-like 3-like protein isoform 2-T2 [Sylvia borin]
MTRSRRQVEASRKKRVQARRTRGGIKKDPGVPQLGRFAASVGQQSKKSRQRRALKVQQRSHLAVHLADALQRQRHFQSQEKEEEEEEPPQPPQDEASLRQFGRELRKVLAASDVVLEVLDARDPQGCRSPQLEGSLRPHQHLVLVLNKIDLVPRAVVAAWLKHLRAEFPAVAFKACTQQQSRNLKQTRKSAMTAPEDVLAGGACLGAERLLHVLKNYGRCGEAKSSITVGVVGYPNVGKSSLINSLKRSRACVVGATPGVTSGKISYYTHPPKSQGVQLEAQILPALGPALDLEALEQGDAEVLAAVPVTVTGLGLSPVEEEEGEAMEDDSGDLELGTMTVELKPRVKSGSTKGESVPRAPSLEEVAALPALFQGQGLQAAGKRRKKLQKRADKIATKLSETLEAAMQF